MGAGERGIQLLVWIIVFTIFTTVLLGFRYWAARISKRTIFLDDIFLILAYMNTMCLCGACIWAIFNGLGKHTDELNMDEIAVQFKLIIVSNVCWTLATVLVKMSILWLYKRIFITRGFKIAAQVMLYIAGAYGIAFFIEFITACHPVSYHWNPVPGGGCRDLSIDEISSISLNIVIDVIIVALPIPTIWGLKMPTRNKVYISILFCMGFLTIGIMSWRLAAVLSTANDPDFVYTLKTIGLIALLELWVGITVACLLTTPPLLAVYVTPVITRLSQSSFFRTLYRSSASDSDHKPNRGNSTFAGGTTERRNRSRKQYQDISESTATSITQPLHSDSLDPNANSLTTGCTYDDDVQMDNIKPDVIQVTHEFEAFETTNSRLVSGRRGDDNV